SLRRGSHRRTDGGRAPQRPGRATTGGANCPALAGGVGSLGRRGRYSARGRGGSGGEPGMNHRPSTGIPGREAQKHALVEALLREEGLALPAGQGIRRREGVDSAPLSSVQERLWLLD